jgi:proteic killer suppression protein
MREQVVFSKISKKLGKVPAHVRIKFQQWVLFVETKGLFKAQMFPGFRDHSLQGNRKGQRSVYLTKKWRAIYFIDKQDNITIIRMEEVTPHDY